MLYNSSEQIQFNFNFLTCSYQDCTATGIQYSLVLLCITLRIKKIIMK